MHALATQHEHLRPSPSPAVPFLATKLHVPRVRAHLVPRPGLVDAIAAVDRRLVLVCAPAGYGKSTLVVQWLAHVDAPVAWVSLDEGDDDPIRFFRLLVAALQAIDREVAIGTEPFLDGQGFFDPQFVAGSLVNDLAAVTRPFVLVLDDYHAVDDARIHAGIGLFLHNMPATMRVVVVTRSEPPLPLGRLRAHGDILELREADLRFTRDESLQFLQGSHGLDLPPAVVDLLTDRTEGWVAGLQLVAHAVRGHSREQARQFAAEIGGNVRFVQDYLWEETLQRQPEPMRAFLLRTSVLDRFNAGLCEAVMGTGDAADLLRRCEQANLFLIPLDDLGRWYRYHHLFADVLRDRLAQETTDDDVTALHRRAAAWLEAQEFGDEAIRHAVAGRDWTRAIRLLEPLCEELFEQDRQIEQRTWLEGLPAEVLERSPRLAFLLAWALGRTGQFAIARGPLAIAERAWTAADDRANLGSVLLWYCHRALAESDTRRGIDCAERALDLLPADRTTERVMAFLLLGIGRLLAGEPLGAEGALASARATFVATRRIYMQLVEMSAAGGVLIQQGKLLDGTALLQRAIALGDPRFAIPLQQALFRLGNVDVERNLLDEGTRSLEEADEMAERTGTLLWRSRICQGLARAAWAQGETEAAFAETERVLAFAGQMNSAQEARNARAAQARFWLAAGQLALARRWADSSGLDPYLPPEYERQFEHLTSVRLLIREQHVDAALRILDAIQQQAEATGRAGDLVELHVLRALAHKAGGDHPSALFALERALALGAPNGYVRVFADEGEEIAPLLRHVTTRGAHRDYAQRLLEVVEGTAPPPRPDQTGNIDALSEREVEVLRLVAAGLPNRAVGERLFISEKTVKKHLSNILGKLGAANRTQAVDQARRLGLL